MTNTRIERLMVDTEVNCHYTILDIWRDPLTTHTTHFRLLRQIRFGLGSVATLRVQSNIGNIVRDYSFPE